RFRRGILEGDVVVPARRGGLVGRRRLLERHTEGRRAAAERGHDARREAVAAGCAEHQHVADARIDARLTAHVVDLLAHVRDAAGRVRRGTDESTDSRLNDHRIAGPAEEGAMIPWATAQRMAPATS